jgi:2-iminobutanoate/2-iminopropanoate deaminase
MIRETLQSPDAPAVSGAYAQAVRLVGARELLFVSGQIPVDMAGEVPESFGDQCRLVWRNIAAQLAAGGMSLADIVKVTTFLASRDHRAENGAIRQEVLGECSPALTVVIAEIYDPRWLLEIEVIAAR